jgi:murein DD-endopeptidase MepM/ murein hydrolase activator NlpD
MREGNQFYTLIITPTTSSRFYKVILHHRHLYAIILGGMAGLSLLAFTSIWVFKQAALLLNYHRVQSENKILKQKQSIMLEQLQIRLASVEAESKQLLQTAQEMGLNVHSDIKTSTMSLSEGVGGPNQLDVLSNELERVFFNVKALRENLGEEKLRLAATPTGWPILGRLNSSFGTRRDPFGAGYQFHSGIDIGANYGLPVQATAAGMVSFAGYQGGYGQVVVVDHGRDVRTYYGHLSRIDVPVGGRVQRGGQIGRVGSSGRSTAPHVHYEIRVKDRPVNPITFGATFSAAQ